MVNTFVNYDNNNDNDDDHDDDDNDNNDDDSDDDHDDDGGGGNDDDDDDDDGATWLMSELSCCMHHRYRLPRAPPNADYQQSSSLQRLPENALKDRNHRLLQPHRSCSSYRPVGPAHKPHHTKDPKEFYHNAAHLLHTH